MTTDDIIQLLDENEEVIESYVMVREVKIFLNLNHIHFNPQIKVRIYKSNLIANAPYHFEVSHYVNTPIQSSPYLSSRTSANTEREAIESAISTTTSFLKNAIISGHEPSEQWLIPNEVF